MAWKKANQTFQAMALYDFSGPGLNLGSGDRPQQIKGIHVSAEYFQVFGVSPAFGRTFLPQEDQPNGAKAAVLSNDLWRTRFGSDPSLVGKPILLGGDPYTVVGILPATFPFRSSRRRFHSHAGRSRTAPTKATICWPPAASSPERRWTPRKPI